MTWGWQSAGWARGAGGAAGWLLLATVLPAAESAPRSGRIEKPAAGPVTVRTRQGRTAAAAPFETIVIEPAPPPASPLPFTIRLRTAEQLAANSFSLAKTFRMESELGALELPGEPVEAVLRQPARTERFRDSFDRLPGRWTLAGQPGLDERQRVSPPTSVLLAQPGQRLALSFESPVFEGVVALWYYDDGFVHPGRRWSIVPALQGAEGPPIVVQPGWDRPYATAELEKALMMAPLAVPRQKGWRALEIDFGLRYLHIRVDGAALVSSPVRGVGRAVSGLAIQIENPADGAPGEPVGVWIDDVVLRGPEVGLTRLLDEPGLACVLDGAGDQWFGALTAADSRKVHLRLAGDDEHTFDWRDVLRVDLAEQPEGAPLVWTGTIGTIELALGSRLVVGLLEADAQSWRIQHPLLGERKLPTSAIRSWTLEHVGRRTLLLAGPIRLGSKADFTFRRPAPRATRVQTHFALAGSLADVYLTVQARGLESSGSSPAQVWLNGRPVDALHRHLPAAPARGVRLRLPLPRATLREGRNELEIRLIPDPKTGAHDEIELSQLAIEQAGSSGP